MPQPNSELNSAKLENELLNKKKLRQETHWFKSWALPFLQLTGTLCLIYVTYIIGHNSQILTSQTTLLDSTQVSNEKKNTLSIIQQTLEGIKLEKANYERQKESDSLINKRAKLSKDNLFLLGANKLLSNNNGSLIKEKNNLSTRVNLLYNDLEVLNNEKDFSRISYNLSSIKKICLVGNLATNYLIDDLQTIPQFRKRTIDSLESFTKLSTPYLKGLVYFILYFGTADVKYKNAIIHELENNFDATPKSQINYYDILLAKHWNEADREEFAKSYITLLKSNRDAHTKIWVLVQISRFQNLYPEFNLAQKDFNSYLLYLHCCKSFYNENQYDDDFNDKIIECLAIMCPQVYISKKFSNIEAAIKMQKLLYYEKGMIDTVALKNISMNTILLNESIFSNTIVERLEKLYNTLDEDFLREKGPMALIEKYRPWFNFWLDFYNEKGDINIDVAKIKILNIEM